MGNLKGFISTEDGNVIWVDLDKYPRFNDIPAMTKISPEEFKELKKSEKDKPSETEEEPKPKKKSKKK